MMSLFVPEIAVLEKVLRSVVVYLFVLLAFRFTGKRQVGQLTPFDLVVLLIISNVVQNAVIARQLARGRAPRRGGDSRPQLRLCRPDVPLQSAAPAPRGDADALDPQRPHPGPEPQEGADHARRPPRRPPPQRHLGRRARAGGR